MQCRLLVVEIGHFPNCWCKLNLRFPAGFGAEDANGFTKSALRRMNHGWANRQRRSLSMNLEIWLPAMFTLGIVSMLLCLLFLKACEKI
jgi:hypothetical protein